MPRRESGKPPSNSFTRWGGNAIAVDLNGAITENLAHLGAERLMTVQADVSSWDLAASTVAKAIQRFGSINGLVNNAGIVRAALIENMTPQQWDDVIRVHLTGAFVWLQAVGRHMVQRRKDGDQEQRLDRQYFLRRGAQGVLWTSQLRGGQGRHVRAVNDRSKRVG